MIRIWSPPPKKIPRALRARAAQSARSRVGLLPDVERDRVRAAVLLAEELLVVRGGVRLGGSGRDRDDRRVLPARQLDELPHHLGGLVAAADEDEVAVRRRGRRSRRPAAGRRAMRRGGGAEGSGEESDASRLLAAQRRSVERGGRPRRRRGRGGPARTAPRLRRRRKVRTSRRTPARICARRLDARVACAVGCDCIVSTRPLRYRAVVVVDGEGPGRVQGVEALEGELEAERPRELRSPREAQVDDVARGELLRAALGEVDVAAGECRCSRGRN